MKITLRPCFLTAICNLFDIRMKKDQMMCVSSNIKKYENKGDIVDNAFILHSPPLVCQLHKGIACLLQSSISRVRDYQIEYLLVGNELPHTITRQQNKFISFLYFHSEDLGLAGDSDVFGDIVAKGSRHGKSLYF